MNQDLRVADYESTVAYFKELHETRFRLLALLPIAAGAAVALIPEAASAAQQLAIGVFGFAITVGLTIYDQRNTLIYNRLVRRAKLLERLLDFPPLIRPSGALAPTGGAFTDRAPRLEILRVPII
jgi:hypothetical protein